MQTLTLVKLVKNTLLKKCMATSEPTAEMLPDEVKSLLARVMSRDGALDLLASLLSDKGRKDQGQIVKQQVEKGQRPTG